MPKDGNPGWIDIGQYFAMEDPVEAGRLLMKESKLVGLNLDDSSRVLKESEPVEVPSGHIESNKEAFEFMRRLAQEPRGGKPKMGAYLVKFRRWPTIRETAAAMTKGVRFSHAFGAEVVAMKDDQVAGFCSLPYLKWVRPYLSEFKFFREDGFEKNQNGASDVCICPIGGDQAAWREDVRNRGGDIHGDLVAGYFYYATVPFDSISSIARLWWVVHIESVGQPVDD
jgi:hypothetical protein